MQETEEMERKGLTEENGMGRWGGERMSIAIIVGSIELF